MDTHGESGMLGIDCAALVGKGFVVNLLGLVDYNLTASGREPKRNTQ